jgi:hypothetical protein
MTRTKMKPFQGVGGLASEANGFACEAKLGFGAKTPRFLHQTAARITMDATGLRAKS